MLYEQQPGRCFAENKLFVGKDSHLTAYSVSDVYRTGSPAVFAMVQPVRI